MLAQTAPAEPAGTCAARRAILERAVAEAPSNVEPARGLRRLFARDHSAAALIRRYGLWPAMERAYELVLREFGPVDVEVSAEDGDGTEFVMVTFLSNSLDFNRMYDLSTTITDEASALIGRRHWYRLVCGVDPGPGCEVDP